MVALVVGGVVMLGLLMARAVPSSELTAAPSDRPAAAAASHPDAKEPPATLVKWTSENAAQWVGNRKHSAAFEVTADNTVSIWLGHFRPILVVRCMSSATEAFVFTGTQIKIEPNTEDHTVTFGFDEQPELSERWPDSAEHDALFAPDGGRFVQRLSGARTLRFGYTPHNASPVVAHFQVSGFRELVEPLAKECGSTAPPAQR